jgi:RNA polymerase sigma-70 factor (ECF subfamily)
VDRRPDEELVRAFLDGDPDAFTAIVERHERRVFNVAYRMLGRRDDAVDASQDVFLTCLRKLRGFRGDAAFTTWLYRVTMNVCYDALRKRKREEPPGEELPEVPAPDDTEATAVDVHRALGQLPEEFRAVVVLHDLQGQPYEAIAEMLGAPLGTVKSRLHRGRVLLGRILRERSDPATASYIEENP